MKNIYVAATGQHIGKTTSTLGIVANLQKMGYNTGYCKPVGQQYLTVDGAVADKDAVLFSQVIGFELVPDWHSPVILARGATKSYLDDPTAFDYPGDIRKAAAQLEPEVDVMVYEGTGHPGVGGIVDLSNADVAKMLGSAVVMVVEGGIGRTIDRLIMSTALFREQQVPIVGVIVNKVIPEKHDEVAHYVGKKLEKMGLPLLGVVPFDKTLLFPIMETVNQAVDGRVALNGHRLNNRVEDIMAGSLVDLDEFSAFRNILLVVSHKRLNEAIEKVKEIARMKKLKRSPLSGVIVTGDGKHENWFKPENIQHPYFINNEIPVISTQLDTYGSVVKVSRIEVKINTRTPWKIKRAITLIREHVDFDLMIRRLKEIAAEGQAQSP
ncbi:AAA family ATPase [Phaeodactylibacter luteus]|uniref:AAA family ATPase n=1 Tax=Phaeodactylibacter luteus TaxID=1564516 RepID=A0A5C6RK64_9BACT|nr:AAA family ATPase [Phaeodactylibacter luteus]TXB62771.1 AAA family ATPase [Phaeodactylibacter luteus]